jgi:hypothetical protein
MPSWDSAEADDLWTKACGKDRWLVTTEPLEQDIRSVSDASLWQFRLAASKSLVEYARERLSKQLAVAGAPSEAIDGAKLSSRRLWRLRLWRGCACGPRLNGLHGASDTALRGRCDPTGRRTNPLAAMIRSTEKRRFLPLREV